MHCSATVLGCLTGIDIRGMHVDARERWWVGAPVQSMACAWGAGGGAWTQSESSPKPPEQSAIALSLAFFWPSRYSMFWRFWPAAFLWSQGHGLSW